MQRVRRAATAVLALVVVLCLSSGPATALPVTTVQAASVAWPPSTLVVSEVQTGGASASDEFVEIANQGPGPVDLIGLELVYSTSSGSTVTRKASWSVSTILAPGKRLLVVNSVGTFAPIGDATYSGGFAATGGAVALRVIGGTVVDAIGWGDATNPFVEGSAAPAAPAGSSLERRPGGALGNGTDTNDNSLDWLVASVPGPQNLASPAIPDPSPTPSPTASASPSVAPTPTASPTAIPTSSPTPTPPPSPSPTDTPEPEPTPTPTATPTVPSATPDPTPSPTPTPTPTPMPTPTATPEPTPSPTTPPTSIAAARALPDGSLVTVSGVLTTDLGALEGGRTAFIQDVTGGISFYLDATVVSPLPAGTVVLTTGVVDERYAQRTLRVSESDLVLLGASGLPPATDATTGTATEALEGTRIRVSGMIVGSPDSLADGSAISVDDGSGPVRVIVTPAALGGRALESGSVVTAAGPLGQRDSTGTGASGYRVYVTLSDEITIEPPATPSPTQTPSPTPAPTSSPSPTEDPGVSPTPSPSPTPSSSPSSPTPSPTPTSGAMTITAARALPVGSTVSVRGVVSAEPGRLGTPALFAIVDDTGGIVVKLPEGIAPPARGRMVDVRGPLADPYGQLEIRPAPAGLSVDGTGDLPAPVALPASGPSESSEGRLVRIDGVVVVRPQKATSGDIGLTIETANGTRVRIMADASSGVGTSAFAMDARYRITGIAGQRASKKGVPDGYRIWVRDAADVDLLAGPPPGSSPSPSGGSQKPKSPATVSIAAALRVTDRDVAIDAVVTAPATLLDASGRRIVVQDGSGAVEILLPKDVKAPTVGARVHAIGRIGSAYGAPRLRASAVERRGSASVPAPLRIAGPLTAAHTWRLVSLGGRVDDVKKLGDRWRAEVVVGAQRLVVVGQPGSRIPSSALVEGRSAEVFGIVRPAYPSASDRRASVLPRTTRDIRLGAATAASGSSTSAGGPGHSTAPGSAAMSTNVAAAPDVDLVELAAHLGQTVRVGGLVVDLGPTGFTLDDGSATGRIELSGPAADMLALIEPDDAINVVGVVRDVEGGELAVVVDDPGAITLGSAIDGDASAAASDGLPEAAVTAPDVVAAGLGSDPGWLPGAGAGLAGLLGISVASVVVAVIRRRHRRHLLTDRIAVRLAALGGPPAARRDPTTT